MKNLKSKKKKNFIIATMSSPSRPASKGTLELEVVEAEELSERRRESTVFCQVQLEGDGQSSTNSSSDTLSNSLTQSDASLFADDVDFSPSDGAAMTPAVPRTSTPVWEHVLMFAIASLAQRVVVRVVDGVPGAQGNKVIGTVQVDLSKLHGNSLDDVSRVCSFVCFCLFFFLLLFGFLISFFFFFFFFFFFIVV
jgi:hypothetical protein